MINVPRFLWRRVDHSAVIDLKLGLVSKHQISVSIYILAHRYHIKHHLPRTYKLRFSLLNLKGGDTDKSQKG